jgi:hypothetical protein
MASPSTIRPAASAVSDDELLSETCEASGSDAAWCLLGCGTALAGVGLGLGDGVMTGKRPAALPAPICVLICALASPFRAGIGPSGRAAICVASGGAWVEFVAVFAFFAWFSFCVLCAEAAVTAVVSAAAGGVQSAVVARLAVAVSFTELTEVAVDAIAIWARRMAGCFVVTELMLHEAVPSSLAQPLVNVGFWLGGCAVSATDTTEADPFSVVTCTT